MHPSCWGVGAFRPRFYRNEIIPCQNVDYNFADGSFKTTKLCSRRLMVFGRNLCEKRQIWVSEPHFGKVWGDIRLWFMARWKAYGWLSIHVNWIFLLRYWSCEAKCVQLGCFCRGSTSLHSNFTWTGSSPSNYSWHQKTRDTGLPASLCIPSFWHNTGVMDRWTHLP